MQRFELGEGYSIKSCVVRELMAFEHDVIETNVDTFHHSPAVKTPEGRQYYRIIESLRLSVVEVNGEIIETGTPYMGIDNWSQRTLSTVISLYVKVNGTDDKDIERFLGQSRPVNFAGLGHASPAASGG
jgi:hypothetical protein